MNMLENHLIVYVQQMNFAVCKITSQFLETHIGEK